MPKLHTTLEPGDVVLIPSGAGAAITFSHKSGKRSRVVIDCKEPVTITKATEAAPKAAGADASRELPIARRPVPVTG